MMKIDIKDDSKQPQGPTPRNRPSNPAKKKKSIELRKEVKEEQKEEVKKSE